jgi:hypothetical protein
VKKAKKKVDIDFIKSVSRKKSRYVLFQAQRIKAEGGTRLNAESLGLTDKQVKDIEQFFLNEKFTVQGFSRSWDIGLDDIFVMGNRPEKYWLFGIRPWVRVQRPVEKIMILNDDEGLVEIKKTWFDSLEEGRNFFKSIGFINQYGKGPKEFHIDYDKIMEDVDIRTSWLTETD